VAYNAALHACANANAFEACVATHARLVAAGLQPDDVSVSVLLGALSRARDAAPDAAAAVSAAAAAATTGAAATTPAAAGGAAAGPEAAEAPRTKQGWDAVSDGVFEASVALRPVPAFFAPPCLDAPLEVDLTSLPLPVARAAVRWALRRVLADRGVLARTLPRPNDDDCEYGDSCEYGESDGGAAEATAAAGWQLGGDYRGGGPGGGQSAEYAATTDSSGGLEAVPAQWADGGGRLGGRPTAWETGDLTFVTGVGVAHTRAAAAARAKVKSAADALRSSAQQQQRARAAQKLSAVGAAAAVAAAVGAAVAAAPAAGSAGAWAAARAARAAASAAAVDGSDGPAGGDAPEEGPSPSFDSDGPSSSSGAGSLRDFVSTLLRLELGLGAAVVPRDAPGTVVVPQKALDAWVAAQREAPTLK
jgi:hypothetical protein